MHEESFDAPSDEPDGRAKTSAVNGANGGCPEGFGHSDKRSYPCPELIDRTADAILAGKRSPLTVAEHAQPLTNDDREYMRRITGIPADEFQARLTARLQTLADATGERIAEKLAEDKFKPGELPYLLAVCVDKLSAIAGRNQVNNASVGLQVNFFDTKTDRAAILATLSTAKVLEVETMK